MTETQTEAERKCQQRTVRSCAKLCHEKGGERTHRECVGGLGWVFMSWLWVVGGWVRQTLLINRHKIKTLIDSPHTKTHGCMLVCRYKHGDRKPHDFDYMLENALCPPRLLKSICLPISWNTLEKVLN